MRAAPLLVLLLTAVACDDQVTEHATGLGSEPHTEAWVSDVEGRRIQAWDLETGLHLGTVVDEASLPAGAAPEGFQPAATLVSDERLLVANFANGDVVELDLDGSWRGLLHANGRAADLRLEEPAALRLLGDHVLVLGTDTGNVALLDARGDAVLELGGSIRNPHGLAVTDDGLVLVATSPLVRELGLVQVWDLESGERVRDFAPWPEVEEGTHVTVDDAGRAVVTDWFSDRILRYDPHTGALLDVWVDAGLDRPIAVDIAPDGSSYVLDAVGVHRIDDDGDVHLVARSGDEVLWARNLEIVTLP